MAVAAPKVSQEGPRAQWPWDDGGRGLGEDRIRRGGDSSCTRPNEVGTGPPWSMVHGSPSWPDSGARNAQCLLIGHAVLRGAGGRASTAGRAGLRRHAGRRYSPQWTDRTLALELRRACWLSQVVSRG